VPSLLNLIETRVSERELREKIEDSNQKLMSFMAFVCHEIRNPLFAITSTIDFMEENQLTTEQERALVNIKQATNLMLRLVNDVLDLSRLESGKLDLEEVNFDIRELIANIAAISETQVQINHETNVEFRFKLGENVPKVVCSDSSRILQVSHSRIRNGMALFILVPNVSVFP
jgi:signal transduction histidine kinase